MAGGAARDAGELGAAVGGGAARPGRRHGDDVGHRPTARRPAGAGGGCAAAAAAAGQPLRRGPAHRGRSCGRHLGPVGGQPPLLPPAGAVPGPRRAAQARPRLPLGRAEHPRLERPHPVRRRCRPRGGAPGRVARPAHPTRAPRRAERHPRLPGPLAAPRQPAQAAVAGLVGRTAAARPAPGVALVPAALRRRAPVPLPQERPRAGRPSIPAPRRRPTAGGGCWRRGSGRCGWRARRWRSGGCPGNARPRSTAPPAGCAAASAAFCSPWAPQPEAPRPRGISPGRQAGQRPGPAPRSPCCAAAHHALPEPSFAPMSLLNRPAALVRRTALCPNSSQSTQWEISSYSGSHAGTESSRAVYNGGRRP